MRYILNANGIEENTELDSGISIGDHHFHLGKEYLVQNIIIIEPSDGIIMLKCKEISNKKRTFLGSKPKTRI